MNWIQLGRACYQKLKKLQKSKKTPSFWIMSKKHWLPTLSKKNHKPLKKKALTKFSDNTKNGIGFAN